MTPDDGIQLSADCSHCVCEGLSIDQVTWGLGFEASSCSVTSSEEDRYDNFLMRVATVENYALEILADLIREQHYAGHCAIRGSREIWKALNTLEQVRACDLSLQAIAAEDGVTCP